MLYMIQDADGPNLTGKAMILLSLAETLRPTIAGINQLLFGLLMCTNVVFNFFNVYRYTVICI